MNEPASEPSSLPTELWSNIVEYLDLSSKIQLGYAGKVYERLIFGNGSNFAELSIPKNMTDGGLETFLIRCNANNATIRLSLVHCCKITGSGLAPLHGSAVLKFIDLRNMTTIEQNRDPAVLQALEDCLVSILNCRLVEIKCSPTLFFRQRIKEVCFLRWLGSGLPYECPACDYCPSFSFFTSFLQFHGLPYCFHCRKWHCIYEEEWITCSSCLEKWCSNCTPSTCQVCKQCDFCQKRGLRTCVEETCCRRCSLNCPNCNETYCPQHGRTCTSCRMALCECNQACETCNQRLCYGCKCEEGCDNCCPDNQDEEGNDETPLENYGYWAFDGG